MKYEDIRYQDDRLPIVFRDDRRVKNGRFHAHWHEGVELILMTEGEMSIHNNSRQFTAVAGQTFCIHSNHLHYYQSVSPTCRYFCIILPTDFFTDKEMMRHNLPLCTDDSETAKLFYRMAELIQTKPEFYREEVRGLLSLLYVRLARMGGEEESGQDRKMTAYVKSAIDYIDTHACEALSLDSVARHVGISPYHLSHIFKHVTGKTMATFWQSVRCDKARKLIKNGKSVAEAAELAGFSSLSHFRKVYKQHFEIQPGKDK